MSTNALISVTINGEQRSLPHGQTVQQLLDSLAIVGDRVAVELNGRVVKAQDRASAVLLEDARVEIVHFVGGG